jgi:hypothetical protein
MTIESSKQNTGDDLLVATFLLGEGTFGLDTAGDLLPPPEL